jgi:hypothetical protein
MRFISATSAKEMLFSSFPRLAENLRSPGIEVNRR